MLGHASCSFIIIYLAACTDRINTTASLHLSFSPCSSLLSYTPPFISFPSFTSSPLHSSLPLNAHLFPLVLAALLFTLHLHHGFISHYLCRRNGVLGLLSTRHRLARLSIYWLRLDKGRMR